MYFVFTGKLYYEMNRRRIRLGKGKIKSIVRGDVLFVWLTRGFMVGGLSRFGRSFGVALVFGVGMSFRGVGVLDFRIGVLVFLCWYY